MKRRIGVALAGLIAAAAGLGFDEAPRPSGAAYYDGADHARGFVLDVTEMPAKMKFDDSSEIILLDATPGPRGDLFLRSQDGGPMIRLSPLGGATLFEDDGVQGQAFGRVKAASKLEAPHRSRADGQTLAASVATLLKARFGLEIVLDVPWSDVPENGALPATIGEAIENAGLALERLASDDLALAALRQRLRTVEIAPGRNVAIGFRDTTLSITVDHTAGLRGRPSSHAIARFLEDQL